MNKREILYTSGMIILLLVIIAAFTATVLIAKSVKKTEKFNEQVGQFCTDCSGKTPNQCTKCFNCGFCVDKFGNSSCIGGDHKGGFNNEQCTIYHYGDPWSKMLQNNAKEVNSNKK